MLHALLKLFLLSCLLAPGWAQALQISASRLWPSPDYTRITLESAEPVAHKYFTLSNPERLVIDLEGVDAGQHSTCWQGSSPRTIPTSARSGSA